MGPHVFVSYKSEDRDVVQQVVIGLRNEGLYVWWDQSLEAGDRFSDEIDRQVRAAVVVLVLWSRGAVGSTWVNDEALVGHTEGKLLAARLEECAPKVPFTGVQAPLFDGWTGDLADPRWVSLARTVVRKVEERSVGPVARRPVDRLVAYRTVLEASLNVVPKVFQHFGPEHMTEVYVEVRLSGERHLDPEAMFPGLPDGKRSILAPAERIRLAEVIERPEPCWALLGPPGSGKTTLVHRLAIDLLLDPERKRVPVVIRAADLADGDTLSKALGRSEWSAHAQVLLEEARGGRAVILVDGLDEHAAPDSDGLKRAIVQLVADAPGSKVLVTSRPIGYAAPSAQFHRLDLCPLEPEAQRELLGRWVPEPARVERTVARMQRSVQLRRLAENPLLLTLVGIVLYDDALELPLHRTALYEQAVRTLLGGAHRRDQPALPQPDLARTALEDLSFILHAKEQPEIPLEAVVAALRASPVAAEVEREWGSLERFLTDVASKTGLLLPYPNHYRPKGYLAPHRSLREYLAAGALRRRPGAMPRVMAWASGRPATWAEVLALLCGLLPMDAADALVRRVIATGSQELTLRVVADAERIKPETVYEVLRVEKGQENWDGRRKVLAEDLPRLVGGSPEPARRVMDLLRKFAETTTHGADLWWCQHLLTRLGAGSCGDLLVPEDVRKDAAALADRFWLGHRPEERAALRAELERWWRPIPAGRFRMGDEDFGPAHDVQVVAGFDMLAVPVRHDWYERFDPDHRADRSERFGAGDTHPVYNVTWYEAMAFAAWLGADVRLPVEVEWEYACRAGTTTRFWSGDRDEDLARVGWYSANSSGRTHPVGEKPANPWGLHDVHGNVWEWCADPRIPYEAATRRHDPLHPDLRLEETGAARVFRGGDFVVVARRARSAARGGGVPAGRVVGLGFRLVRVPAPEP